MDLEPSVEATPTTDGQTAELETPSTQSVAPDSQAQDSATDEFQYKTQTGQKYRTVDDILKAQEHATRTIAEQNMRLKQYEQFIALQQQQTVPKVDPVQTEIETLTAEFTRIGYDPASAREAAILQFNREQAITRRVEERFKQQQVQQWASEYQQIRSSDPTFDVNENEIAATIYKAYPEESPAQHYERYLKYTGRTPTSGVQAALAQQAQQRRQQLSVPADGGNGAVARVDPQAVQASVDFFVNMQRQRGVEPTEAQIQSVRQRALSKIGSEK